MSPLRVIFMGTAELACASLAALAGSAAFQVLAVVTQPDRPKGRDLKLQPTPVKVLALRLGLPILQPERARAETFIQELAGLRPDLITVAAYGQILPAAILDLPRFGCVNVHTSLLPKYRGAAPIQWAILDGEPQTGVTIMKMDAGLDTGPILAQQATVITSEDDAQTLHNRLAELGSGLLLKTIPDYVAGKTLPQPQPVEGISYARKITRQDGLLDWHLPARALGNRVRGLTPWPGAFTHLPGEFRPPLLKVWRAEITAAPAGGPGTILEAGAGGILVSCGEGALRLLEVQREGGRRLAARDFLAGHPLGAGARFPPG